jgi:hypothetical protein
VSTDKEGMTGRYDMVNDQFIPLATTQGLQRDPASTLIALTNSIPWLSNFNDITLGLTTTTREKDAAGEDIPNTRAGPSVITLNENYLKQWNSRRSANKAYLISQVAADNVFKKTTSYWTNVKEVLKNEAFVPIDVLAEMVDQTLLHEVMIYMPPF